MEGEGNFVSNLDDEMKEILAEFMVVVVQFEELVEVGRKYLIRFQQALEVLQHPSIYESSELVRSIIKANKTKRINAYVEAGCINAFNNTNNVSHLNTSLGDLRDFLTQAKIIIDKLESLVDKAGNALIMNQSSEQVVASQKLDAADCASYIAVIYSMLKQDYTMQNNIVSSLNFTTSNGELESYCLMWMLRPFINDGVIHQALRYTSIR
ncbi:uncharacterized protein LOC110722687 [Chenopodium quinoa]|nr:uncharacterized protein LOC110722687 [Chenopodium quinoa]XP_021757659.1 uncharacterized protein LOC110722687 [Chenopodium quinoa]XP_021757660.1 uncharacterized protein LOC110722687 [Chenopodium quinoa]